MRALIVIAIVAVVTGGAGFYFVKVYRPKQIRSDAQAEINEWDARFAAARACLLGPDPGSSKTAEALAIREMSAEAWKGGSCTSLMGKLARSGASQSGIDEVERAWAALDAAAAKAATAFANHVALSTTMRDDPLPRALDELESARAKLRAAADLPPAEPSGKPLPVAQVLPLEDQTDRLTSLEMRSLPSAHGVIEYGRTDSRMVQLTLTAGGKPRVGRGGPNELRATPDDSWGAMTAETEVRIGAMDVEGAIAAPKTVAAKAPKLVAVTGTLADGTVVYTEDKKLVVVHVKAGEPTADPAIEIATAVDPEVTAEDADGRIALVWKTKDARVEAKLAGDAQPILLPGDPSAQPCLSRDRAWVTAGTQIIGFGGGKLSHAEAFGDLIGCAPDGAIVRLGGQPQRFLVCSEQCREAQLPKGAPSFATSTLINGKLAAIVEHGGVLAVWREGAEPAFYSLPEPAHPVQAHEWPAMALTDGKVLDVIARAPKTFVIVRVPTGS